ncbi:MAG TPA: PepSY-like domain-containing protein, partial [Candidatus Limnocylindria bacterium]|nr:PepSY-like domain-containing protein [Candidatus Limnocylindria bacterium]
MKNYLLHLTAACVVLTTVGIQARADKIPPGQAPKAVLDAIMEQAQTKGEPAKEIDRETKDGKTIYNVEFTREGLNRHVKFNEDGSLVTEDRGFADVTSSSALNTLPAPVQKTLEEQRAGRVVADIDKEMSNGQTVYEVEFKEQGPNSRIHIAADGSLIASKGARGTYVGTQLSEAPKPVQDAVRQTAGTSAEVADVDRRVKDGGTVYNVEIRQEGLNRDLQIAESGAVLRDSKMENVAGRTRDAAERVRE